MLKNLLIFVFVFVFIIPNVNASVKLTKTNFENLVDWNIDDHASGLRAFKKSCASLSNNTKLNAKIKHLKINDLIKVCKKAKKISSYDNLAAQEFFEKWFTPFVVRNGVNKTGLFTGYYEIQLNGSFKKTKTYQYPVYKKPKDLKSGKKYYTRKQIEKGKLKGRKLELIYVDDKIDLFFLHVQGSGRIVLENGKIVNVGFAGKNNHEYTSIGKEMINKGIVTAQEISATKLKQWLKENPNEAENILHKNKSYVFFQKTPSTSVIGSQGVALTPERSLAVDRTLIPFGLPIWLETTLPKEGGSYSPYNRLMVSQDTGSAIKGAVRGDVFFGNGQRAEKLASAMSQKGKYFILLPVKNSEKKVSGSRPRTTRY